MAKPLAIALSGPLIAVICSPAEAQERTIAPQPMLSDSLDQAPSDIARSCKSNPEEVVICGRSQQRFRIDPNVLAATRAAEAPPPKPALDASSSGGCIGPNCGGGTIPLVGMALTAIKAVTLAAQGDDWREAFRMHPDQYDGYRQAEARKKAEVAVRVDAGK